MITLPAGWMKGIQVRDWMEPVNAIGEITILVLSLKNKNGQIYTYQQNNEDYTLTDMSKKDEVLKDMYDRLVFVIPGVVGQQETVAKLSGGYEPITNDEWEIFPLLGLTFYKDKAS